LGLHKGAEERYRKALSIDPDHVEANHNLANRPEERNELDNAILFYRKAIHEVPEFADIQ
jgi:Tfp pilus assembly protein PilF